MTKELYKTRLISKVFQQKKGIDYNEMFAPINKVLSIRLLLAHFLCLNLSLHQFEVKNALFNVKLNKGIFMR